MSTAPDKSPDREIVKTFEAAGVVDYLQYLQSSRNILWTNFKAGIAKGFGISIGMSLVLGLVVWMLTMLVNLPVIGEYFERIDAYLQEYEEKTNYTEEFEKMNGLLEEIRDNTGR